MRFILVATSLLGLAAASPCKPKSKSSSSSSSSSLASATASPVTTASPSTKSSSGTTTQSLSTAKVTTTTASTTPSPTTTKVATTTSSSSSVSTVTTVTSAAPTTTSKVSTTSAATPTPTPTSTTLTTQKTTSSASTTTVAPTTTKFTTSTTSNPATASVTVSKALAWYDSRTNVGASSRNPPNGGYECFAGPASNFPAMSTWASFDALWDVLNRDEISHFDSASEQADIRQAILDVSSIAKVDPRVILAVIVDESSGNVRAACTTNGVPNCGLMQAYNSSSYDPSNQRASIRLMVQDGTQGTIWGPGLVQLLNGSPLSRGTVDGNIYNALRAYNSGKINNDNLSDAQGATAEYVSNVANFLQGWNGYGNGAKNCDFSKGTNSFPPSRR